MFFFFLLHLNDPSGCERAASSASYSYAPRHARWTVRQQNTRAAALSSRHYHARLPHKYSVGRLACPYYNPLQFEFNRPPFLPYYACGRGHVEWLTLRRSTKLRPLLLISPRHLLPFDLFLPGPVSRRPPCCWSLSLPLAILPLLGGARSFTREQEVQIVCWIAKGVSRHVDSLSSLSPGPHASFAGCLQMQTHTPGPLRWVRGCRVIATLSARGWGLAASWRGRLAAWGTMGRSCWWWDQSNTWKGDVSTRQDALFTSKL